MAIVNEQLKTYAFLRDMQNDAYFPPHLVAKGQQILIGLCEGSRPGARPTWRPCTG